ncbi:hypothetical protein U8335_04295 [Roseiconus lacunae]|uniref:hypothetical protein n=1 Tax=Roseiconus lacunae TaxID=2605694 RepID=UPI00308C3F34|nr:hypothetical protein U8335_04295 [Stieleria sp. HD01]
MTPPTTWTFNDGWILMSVYMMHGEDGASLSDLIAAADAMNHAIPTSGELSRALTRLAKCNIVKHVQDRFRIAQDYLPAIAAARDRKGGLFATPDKGKRWLASTTFVIDEDARITIHKADVTAAFDQYRNALKRS